MSRATENFKGRGHGIFRAALCAALAAPALLVAGCHAAPALLPPSLGTKHMGDYQVLVNYEELRLDVRVNDMPVLLNTRGQGFGVYVINNLLIGADNTLTVTVKPPHGAAHAPANASMHINVTASSGQDGGNKGRVLYNYEWKMKDIHAPLPSLREHFQAQPPSEPLSWQNAAKIQLTDADKAAISAQIRRLYHAMETKNVAETAALLVSEAHDQAVGFGMPLAHLEADQRQGYQEDFSQSDWHLSPINYGALEYDLYGGGRVVLVHTRDGRKVFTSAPDKDGSSVAFDPLLSQINGQWVIIK